MMMVVSSFDRFRMEHIQKVLGCSSASKSNRDEDGALAQKDIAVFANVDL